MTFSVIKSLAVVPAAVAVLVGALACTPEQETLRVGYLADFSGPLAELGQEIQKGVELAVEHANASGGVFGKPVELVTADTALENVQAIQEARRLVEVEGVNAIVGPIASGIAFSIVESVTADARIPVITTGTAPSLRNAKDNDYLFRNTLSDAAQGKVLAELLEADGVDNVAVLYVNNPYGEGLFGRFKQEFDGEISVASHEQSQPSYLAELESVASGGGKYLISMSYIGQAEVYVREAIEQGLFTDFYFTDATRSEELIDAIGAENLEGSKGTVPSSDDNSDSFKIFNSAFEERYGSSPSRPFIREGYDATIAIIFAAESAGSSDGMAIRDSLRGVASPGGEIVVAGEEGVSRGLSLIRSGEEVNYEGAATSLDWDSAGDVPDGFISIWAYQNGEIADIRKVYVSLE